MHKNKSLSRYLCVQAVYQMAMTDKSFNEILEEFLNFHLNDIALDFEKKIKVKNYKVDKSYFIKLCKNYDTKKELIKSLIESNIGKSWTIERLPRVLSSIIEVSVSEMMISPNLTLGIVASEYIILTETFCSENESSFVNALIENIFKSIKVKI